MPPIPPRENRRTSYDHYTEVYIPDDEHFMAPLPDDVVPPVIGDDTP